MKKNHATSILSDNVVNKVIKGRARNVADTNHLVKVRNVAYALGQC